MTIAQLKRHIDRRFADTRKQLQRCATKEDLRRFATKDDLTASEARMNARLGDMTRQVERQFESLGAKFNGFSRFARERIDLYNTVLDEHDERLKDLERGARSG